MKIEVFYTKSILDPYLKPISGLEYEKIDQWDHFCIDDSSTLEEHLENIFKIFNLGPRARRLGKRSMCVGDVVLFDDESAWYCHTLGWLDVSRQMIPSGTDSIAFKEM